LNGGYKSIHGACAGRSPQRRRAWRSADRRRRRARQQGHRQGRNHTRELNDVTAHAEIVAIRLACEELGQERLAGADLYVTLEPCTMCAAAISFARIRRLYFGAEDPKGGGVDNGVRFYQQPTCHHAPEVYSGLGETSSAEILRRFFQAKRSED